MSRRYSIPPGHDTRSTDAEMPLPGRGAQKPKGWELVVRATHVVVGEEIWQSTLTVAVRRRHGTMKRRREPVAVSTRQARVVGFCGSSLLQGIV